MTTQPTERPATRTFRAPDDLWHRFTTAVGQDPEAGISQVLRQFLRWYAGEPGAKLPQRPLESCTCDPNGRAPHTAECVMAKLFPAVIECACGETSGIPHPHPYWADPSPRVLSRDAAPDGRRVEIRAKADPDAVANAILDEVLSLKAEPKEA